MESDTSLTASTVSNFLLRFSKSNSPNGCSPRLLPAIRELGGREREELGSFPGPLIIRVSPPGINRLRAIHGAAVHPLFATCRGPSEPANIASGQFPQDREK